MKSFLKGFTQLVFLGVIVGTLVALFGTAMAQPDVLQPDSWFTDADAVTAIGVVLASYVVRIATALGKEWFSVDGPQTRWLAMGISVVVAGIGGFLSLGMFSDVSGPEGAARAIVMIVLGGLGAIGKAEYDRQKIASGTERVAAKTKVLQP